MARLTKLIDNLFRPVVAFLDQIISKLSSLGTVAAKGVRLDDYFGFFAILGPAWTSVISSFLTCLTFVFVLFLIQKYGRVILWFKDLIKWW